MLHSRTVSDILIFYNSYMKGVSCPTVGCFKRASINGSNVSSLNLRYTNIDKQ